MRRCASVSARRPAPGRGDLDELGAAVVRVGAALDVAVGRQGGELPAGDGEVDAQILGDVADAQRPPDGDDGERGEPLPSELHERVAADVAQHAAQAVQLADQGFGGCHVVGGH